MSNERTLQMLANAYAASDDETQREVRRGRIQELERLEREHLDNTVERCRERSEALRLRKMEEMKVRELKLIPLN